MTPCTLRLLTLLQISIHTSAREVTQHKTKVQNIFSHFNPHFRKGSDGQDIDWTATEDDISIHTSAREVTAKVRVRIMPKPISIHTSAREVTCSLDHWMHRKPYFNPHFRKGSDTIKFNMFPDCTGFQSTLPQGKWLWEVSRRGLYVPYFNPHFRKGSDCEMDTGIGGGKYFNPHFRKGSDLPQLELLHFY